MPAPDQLAAEGDGRKGVTGVAESGDEEPPAHSRSVTAVYPKRLRRRAAPVPYASAVARSKPIVAGLMCAVAAVLVAACATGDDPAQETSRSSAPPPVATAADFPTPGGRTLDEIREGLAPGPVLAPSASLLEPGRNRFGFGLFDRARKQIDKTPVALYVAPAGGGEAKGPFPATWESLETDPAFRSESTAGDPDAARSLYLAKLPFPKPGQYELLGVVRLDKRLMAAEPVQRTVTVVKDGLVPKVGERAPRISTPTKDDVASIEEIETRVPPDSMHEVDFADVLGKRPIVLLFATPALCQSRVCGPVVDIAEQVKAAHKGDAAFIHMEIFNDNRPERGQRPQVRAWSLPTEPWAFAIDRNGVVAARLEGAFSAKELEAAVKAATDR